MSELTTPIKIEIPGVGTIESADLFLKSEADKVISEKDAEIAELKADYKEACGRLQTANLIKDEQLAATRHSNHKRCLAMARYCELREDEFGGDFAKRWLKKWLELAEKFKEEK